MLKKTLPLSIPVAMGYIPLGMVFGFLLIQTTGLAWWWASVMSLFIFAGAMQFLSVTLLAAHTPLWTIAVATLIVNVRHIFYGLSLLTHQPKRWWARVYMWFALTDETYSVLTTIGADVPMSQRMGVMLLNHGWWILGSTLGALLGAQLTISIKGLEFSLLALFSVLAVEQWKSTRNFRPFLSALIAYPIAYVIATLIAPEQALLFSIVIALLAGIVMYQKLLSENRSDQRRNHA